MDIGPRPAGTPQDVAARDYVAFTLRSYGYDVEIQEYAFQQSTFLPGQVSLPDIVYSTYAFRGSASADVRAPVIAAGIGRPTDFPAGETAGAIALIERGELTFAEKASNALGAGAAAVIIFNNVEEPLRGGEIEPIDIPVVALERNIGHELLSRLELGPLTATVTVTSTDATSYNVVARPTGVSICETLTGGHYDSVPAAPGADDNASGTAAVLELARIVAASRTSAAHCFALFGAEEVGLIGSREFVQRLTDQELNALRIMVNIDVVGITEQLTLIGSEDAVEIARLEAAEESIDVEAGALPASLGSDHVHFLRAGIPVLMLNRRDPLIHTQADTIDRIDPASMEAAVRLAWATLQAVTGD